MPYIKLESLLPRSSVQKLRMTISASSFQR